MNLWQRIISLCCWWNKIWKSDFEVNKLHYSVSLTVGTFLPLTAAIFNSLPDCCFWSLDCEWTAATLEERAWFLAARKEARFWGSDLPVLSTGKLLRYWKLRSEVLAEFCTLLLGMIISSWCCPIMQQSKEKESDCVLRGGQKHLKDFVCCFWK